MNQLLLAIVMTVSLILIVAAGITGFFLGKQENSANPVTSPTPPPPTAVPSPTLSVQPSPITKTPTTTPAPTSTSAPTATTESVDFGACVTGDGYSRAVGFGSTSLQIVQSNATTCVVQTRNETEGYQTTSQCNVPKALGRINFTITSTGSDFSAIKSYCNITSTTNINIHN